MASLSTPGSSLAKMRDGRPLVQCITNFVAMNISANVLLAAGASPAMVHSTEEAAEFAAIAGAVSINIGTLSPAWVEGMLAAVNAANANGKSWVLDPVACFATRYRRAVTADLLALAPTVIRGNASEIIALSGGQGQGSGVDSGDPVAAAEDAARRLAQQHKTIVAATGAIDFVTDGNRSVRIEGGSPLMPQVTALGCSLSSLVAAFVATQTDPFEATVAAHSLFAVAGDRAAAKADGPGSFGWRFLDALTAVSPEALDAEARVFSI